jgi:hypothetical protein
VWGALVLLFFCINVPSAGASHPAQGNFGINSFDVTYQNQDGTPATQAGSHPFAFTTSLAANLDGAGIPEGRLRDLFLTQVPGLIADTTAYPRCTTAQFLDVIGGFLPDCPLQTVIGITGVSASEIGHWYQTPVYNLTPPPGVLARFGFLVANAPVLIDAGITQSPPYIATAASKNTSQILEFLAAKTQLWGDPTDPAHDHLRGACGFEEFALPSSDPADFQFVEKAGQSCPVPANPRPFLTLPTTCTQALPSSFLASSWEGDADAGQILNHDPGGGPAPFSGCGSLPGFDPSISAQPTSAATTSPTGLDFSLDLKDEGLVSTGGRSKSDIRRVEVTLPEGMSANPSLAEGLAVCSEADLEAETLSAEPGEGCPQAAKIGSLEVESPLVQEAIKGSLYQATPYENLAEDSLLAFYIVLKNKSLGIIVKQPAKVISDPQTGQLTTITDELPQLPFSAFKLHFREGTRSPLITPPTCGNHQVKALLTPYSGAPAVESSATFQIVSGAGEAPCPSGGLPPFHPGLIAGSLNAGAGQFSPFYLDLNRSDSEQEITHFSIKLPPGLLGRLAGIPFCSEAQIAAATARTGPLGGHEELADPSCPAASQVGRTQVGSGVGPSLAYAPGAVYLAGPYHGAPISFVAITAGVVGPFDIGTVVVRLALRVNPETGEVFLDSTGSDPIPHIIKGIPVHLRDIRAYTDRPDFTFNPTSCTPTQTSSTVLGAGLDFVSALDDNPLVVSTRFQAADCAALPFKPRLSFKLLGSTKRGGNPALHAHLAMKGIGPTGTNEAGVAYTQVALPATEFLDQAHIDTICTRVIFKEGAHEGEKCPAGSIIGTAKALTPILEQPLTGNVYLRSNPERNLPDLAATLQGEEISVTLVGHTDSAKGGGVRNTFEVVPDAPVTSFDLNLFGGNKGLLENAPKGTSNTICGTGLKATVKFKGHNGKASNYQAPLNPTGCKKHKKHKKRHGKASR